MEIDYNINSHKRPCPKVDCRKEACICGLKYVSIPSALGDDSPKSGAAPKKGEYCNAIVKYEANDHIYVYSKEGIPTLVEGDNISKKLQEEIEARVAADETLQNEIDELKNSPDVVDIVATYADLMDYDTSTLGDRDVIRVLVDETHDNESSYYRWDKTNSQWVFIGAVEGYYTKGQTDDLLDEKQDKLTAGSNISIDANNVISGAYTHFTGATASTDGVQGLVPGPLAGDEGKFLKADGTWDDAGSNYSAGDGIDITSDVISAINTGKPILLTTADYNYPAGNPTSVGLWMLPAGFYSQEIGVNVRVNSSTTISSSNAAYFLVGEVNGEGRIHITSFSGDEVHYYTVVRSSGSQVGNRDLYTYVRDYLTSTSPSAALSANQGRVLNDKIGGDLSNLTTTDKTSLINAINEVAGQSGGGGVKELTTADYNWPTTGTATSVALWLLPAGLYHWQDGVSVNSSANRNVGDYGFREALVTPVRGESIGILLVATASNAPIFTSTNIPSAIETEWMPLLSSNRIKQDAGTSTSDLMSQNATTNMFYKTPNSSLSSIGIGYYTKTNIGSATEGNVVVGNINNLVSTNRNVMIGENTQGAESGSYCGTAVGTSAKATATCSVALGSYAVANTQGQFDVSTGTQTTSGYNSTKYRLLTGLYDGQSAHDAATVGQITPTTDSSAPTSSTAGRLGEIRIDTTDNSAYMCVVSDSVTPAYEWKKITA